MNYIVAGGGRTGSHLVHEIIKFIRPDLQPCFDFSYPDNATNQLVHTNNLRDIVSRSTDVACNETLIICRRRNVFSAVMSLCISRQIDEWFKYSDNDISPFIVDPDLFLSRINSFSEWYKKVDRVKSNYYRNIDIWFEDLISADNHEHYITDQLEWPRCETKTDGWSKNKSPRRYQDLISNWEELYDLYQESKK